MCSKKRLFSNNFLCPAPVPRRRPRLATAACRSLSLTDCSSPPGRAEGLRAYDDVRGATAAPWPASGAQPTGRAWPAAGGPRTWEGAGLLVVPVGMAYQKLGVAASRVHAAAVPGAGWGWHREGRESAPGEVRLPEGLRPADGPPSLENTQDIHHHLGAEGLAGAGGGVSGCASAGGGGASR